MRSFARHAAAVSLAALVLPAAAAGQDHRYAAGYNAGGIYFTQLNPSPGQVDGGSARDLTMDPGWVIGLQFEKWFGGGRLGARVNGAITERGLEVPGRSPRDVGFWLADASVLLRILAPEAGRRVAPFLSAGVGAVQYRLGDGDVLNYVAAASVYDGNDAARFAVNGGLGFDIMTSLSWDGEPIGIRIEGTDHVALESPFRELATGDRYGLVHNVRVTLGVFTGFGVLR